MQSRKLLLFLVFLLMLGACDDGPEAVDAPLPTGDPVPSDDELQQRLWEVMCDAAYDCQRAPPHVLALVGNHASASACKASNPRGLEHSPLAALAARARGERAIWDAEAADACFVRIHESLCGGGFQVDADCSGVLVGVTAEGKPCLAGECAGDNVCISELSGPCYGTCGRDLCGGATCGDDEFCGDGACTKLSGAGEPCGEVGVSACRRDLVCGSEGTCVEWSSVPEGGFCQGPLECASGLICSPSTGAVAEPTCVPLQLRELGESCWDAGSCRPGLACLDLVDDPGSGTRNGECAAARADGEVCQSAFQCAPGLRCTAAITADTLTDGVCEPAGPASADCETHDDCTSGVCNSSSICIDEVPAGEQCDVP